MNSLARLPIPFIVCSLLLPVLTLVGCMKAERLSTDSNSPQGLVLGFGLAGLGVGFPAPVPAVRDRGVVESGFLIGQATGGSHDIATVEVSLDGGAYSPAVGTTSWSFKLPTGTDTWRQGSQHTIAVRSKDSAGALSSVATITVRKGTNRDVNGDGYVDLAVGAYGADSYKGRAYVFHGSASGITASSAVAGSGGPNAAITGENAYDSFGVSVALGDVNGDGYADLAVGAYGFNSSTGRAYVFHGSASGITVITAGPGVGGPNTIITGESAGNFFGESMAFGDVNGDGYADLAIGARGYAAGASYTGRAYVFHSSASGITATTAGSGANTAITGEAATNYFGGSVALGDVNGDGHADLAVGAYGYNSSTGRAYVFHSAGSGGITATTATTGSAGSQITLTGGASGDSFGIALALGDVNGDGLADLAVGASGWTYLQGRAYVYHNTGTGIGATAATTITGATPSPNGNGSLFGSVLALGDVNGDGYADLAVGARAYMYPDYTGRAYVFRSGGSVGISAAVAGGATTIIEGEGNNSSLGFSVALGDVNGDGYADLAAGASGYSTNTGRAYVVHSSGVTGLGTGLLPVGSSACTAITGGATINYFGSSLGR